MTEYVWYSAELDAIVIERERSIDLESGLPCTPIEWDWKDLVNVQVGDDPFLRFDFKRIGIF